MTREEFLLKQYAQYFNGYHNAHQSFFVNPSIARVEPFKITDNVYYVGDRYVCVHMIDTGDGLILIDSGYIGAEHILVDSIWRAGFDPKNVKWIIHSHGHSDHFGASNEFKKMYGTKLAISRVDGESLKEFPKRAHIKSDLFPYARVPEFDRLLEDTEVFELGNTRIRCLLTPGHTIGVMSLFFNTTYNKENLVAATFGGAGVGALTLAHRFYNGFSEDLPQMMLESIERVIDERVDVPLGNHPGNNRTFEKREKQKKEGNNPFIEPDGWRNALTALRESVYQKIRENEELEKELEKL